MLAPAGAPINENVSVVFLSGSVAVAVKVSVLFFAMDLLPIEASTGVSATAVTVIFTFASCEATQPTLTLKLKESFPE